MIDVCLYLEPTLNMARTASPPTLTILQNGAAREPIPGSSFEGGTASANLKPAESPVTPAVIGVLAEASVSSLPVVAAAVDASGVTFGVLAAGMGVEKGRGPLEFAVKGVGKPVNKGVGKPEDGGEMCWGDASGGLAISSIWAFLRIIFKEG